MVSCVTDTATRNMVITSSDGKETLCSAPWMPVVTAPFAAN